MSLFTQACSDDLLVSPKEDERPSASTDYPLMTGAERTLRTAAGENCIFEVIITQANPTEESIKTTFEGARNLSGLCWENGGKIPGTGATFLSWTSGIDEDAPGGGSANTANEPSPETAIGWLDGTSRDIAFDPPISKLGFFYATTVDLTVTVYDSANNVLADSTFTENNYGQCQGDPNGLYCQWDQAEISLGADQISRVNFFGGWNVISLDDVEWTRTENYCPQQPWFQDPSLRAQLEDLWEASNYVQPGQDASATREQAGWIVQAGDSYHISTEGVSLLPDGCTAHFDVPPPEGARAKVHTHPFGKGDYPNACGQPIAHFQFEGDAPSGQGDDEGDIPTAQYFAEHHGISFDYILYHKGIVQFEPPYGGYGKYEGCLVRE